MFNCLKREDFGPTNMAGHRQAWITQGGLLSWLRYLSAFDGLTIPERRYQKKYKWNQDKRFCHRLIKGKGICAVESHYSRTSKSTRVKSVLEHLKNDGDTGRNSAAFRGFSVLTGQFEPGNVPAVREAMADELSAMAPKT